jgi:CBS-domain-containing membrane protein
MPLPLARIGFAGRSTGGTDEGERCDGQGVVTASPDTTVEGLARLMINLRISGVPVLDKEGRLVGMVTEGDLLRRVEIGTECHRPRWSEPFSSNSRLAAEYVKSHAKRVADVVVVTDGVVHLWGIVRSEDERRALRVAAENIPGVRGVEGHTEFAPGLPAI